MKKLLLLSLLTAIIYSCEKTEPLVNLNTNENLSFIGTFQTSENFSGTIILNISKGHYECITNLPYGHGAGKLESDQTSINFIDTLFFPIPAIYGPSYVLTGEHFYTFDGNNLKIWREKNIEYSLEVTTPSRP